MVNMINAIIVTSQMLIIFFCAFLAIYLLACALLPLERGLSRYIWSHSRDVKPAGGRSGGAFREFSRRHHHG